VQIHVAEMQFLRGHSAGALAAIVLWKSVRMRALRWMERLWWMSVLCWCLVDTVGCGCITPSVGRRLLFCASSRSYHSTGRHSTGISLRDTFLSK